MVYVSLSIILTWYVLKVGVKMLTKSLINLVMASLALVFSPLVRAENIALVIGNDTYPSLGDLPIVSKNADQLTEALNAQGFVDFASKGDVVARRNLNANKLGGVFQDFETAFANSEPGSVGFVYFAGHGIAKERRGDVYILSTDSDLRSGVNLDSMGVPLADIVQLLRSHKDKTIILVVDACRNVVPAQFFDSMVVEASTDGGGWGADTGQVGLLKRGFQRDLNAFTKEASDYFIAFSTSPDRVAFDSDVFSSILSNEIKAGRVDLLTLFKRVGEKMAVETRRQGDLQLPTYEVGIYNDPPCFGKCPRHTDSEYYFDCAGCPWMKPLSETEGYIGSPASEKGRDKDEPILSKMQVDEFAISSHEVTRAEWAMCEVSGGCANLTKKNRWQSPKTPIAGVTAKDAQDYIKWISRESGKSYRLPTHTEWELASRAGTTTPFFVGETIEPSQAAYDYSASYNGSRKAEYRGEPSPVGAYIPNDWGLYDLHGNVWEWVCGQVSDGDCVRFELRGGSYKTSPKALRSANRFKIKPTAKREDVGLRVVSGLE